MIIVNYTALTFATLFATFVFFCAVMHLRGVRDAGLLADVPLILRLFAYATLFIGLLLDVLLNVLLSAILIELPCELLTTARMARLKHSGTRWQRTVASWMCKQLDVLDRNHCG